MLMIRFQRTGRKNDPAFRIAVLEKTAGPKAGKYVDLVGTYNPKTKAANIKQDAIKDWVSKGAQVSPSVHNLLVNQGITEGKKSAKVVKQSELGKNIAKKKAEDEAAAAKAAEDAAAAKTAEEAEAAKPVEEETVAQEEVAAATEEMPAAEEAEPAPAEEAPVEEEAPAEETAPEAPAEEAPAA